jgi:hypothetical protein
MGRDAKPRTDWKEDERTTKRSGHISTHDSTNRFSFVIAAAFLFAGPASPFVLLVNPKNGTTVDRSGMGRGITSAVMVKIR